MPILTVDFSADGASTEALGTYLSDRGLLVDRAGTTLQVSASSFKDCELLGGLIAEFVAVDDVRPPLHIDGPGGESMVRRLNTDEDSRIISGLLASCAGLQ